MALIAKSREGVALPNELPAELITSAMELAGGAGALPKQNPPRNKTEIVKQPSLGGLAGIEFKPLPA